MDDDPDERGLFIEAVKEVDENIECIIAKNGLQALERLSDDNYPLLPDIIFLDVSMPLLNGSRCLAQIKDDRRLASIPVIIYTTSRNVEESASLKEMGADFISKPRDAAEIYNLVVVVLEQHLFAAQKRPSH